MRAVPVQETIIAGLVPVEDEIFAQQAHGLRRLVVQLGHGGDRHPVAPKQLSHRRASADLRQSAVLFVAQHRFESSISVSEGGLSRDVLRDYLRFTELNYFSTCVVVLPFAVKAMWENAESGVAPCQCFSSAGMCTTSPTLMTSWCASVAMMPFPEVTNST